MIFTLTVFAFVIVSSIYEPQHGHKDYKYGHRDKTIFLCHLPQNKRPENYRENMTSRQYIQNMLLG